MTTQGKASETPRRRTGGPVRRGGPGGHMGQMMKGDKARDLRAQWENCSITWAPIKLASW